MRSEERDPIDALLDEALAGYSSHEPRPGLEQRILNRVRAAGLAPRFAFPRWVFAVPALACLLLWAGIFWIRHAAKPERPEVAHTVAKISAPPVPPATPEPSRRAVRRRHARYPKLPQFPAPAPITNEERALLALVARAPKEAREALAETRPRNPEPVRIEEINIPPLQSDGLE